MRVMINCQPGASVHFVGEIVKRIGFRDSGLFFMSRPNLAWDYSHGSIEDHRTNPNQFHAGRGTNNAHRVQHGEFAKGHLGNTPEVLESFNHMKWVVVVRELRESFAELMQFGTETRRHAKHNDWINIENPKDRMMAWLIRSEMHWFKNAREISGFQNSESVLVLPHEELRQSDGHTVSRIAEHLECEITSTQACGILQEALKQKTVETIAPYRFEDCWSDDAEALFQRRGGLELNRKLGYEESKESCLQSENKATN